MKFIALQLLPTAFIAAFLPAASIVYSAIGYSEKAYSKNAVSHLTVDEPQLLDAMQTQGFSFEQLFCNDATAQESATLATVPHQSCANSANYKTMTSTLSNDILAAQANGTSVAIAKKTRSYYFPTSWLQRSDLSFKLISLVLKPEENHLKSESCGEARLIYRLSYCQNHDTAPDINKALKSNAPSEQRFCSFLPMTAMLSSTLPLRGKDKSSCIQSWYQAESSSKLLQNLLSTAKVWQDLEVNLQLGHWPSSKDGRFFDQVHYLMRAFRRDNVNGLLQPVKLNNMPDVQRLAADPSTKSALLTWLTDPVNLSKIDHGMMQLPQQFLAESALSVSAFGRERAINQPFSTLYDLEISSPLPGYKNFSDIQSLLEFVDRQTCAGCHQNHSVAGFHVFGSGVSGARSLLFNQLADGHSPFFEELHHWRQQNLDALFDSQNDAYFFPDIKARESNVNAIANRDSIPQGNTEIKNGDACDESILVAHANPFEEYLQKVPLRRCGIGSVCASSLDGFPNGMCVSYCSKASISAGNDGSFCTQVPALGGFSTCMLDSKEDFEQCVAKNSVMGRFPSCHSHKECRIDYACVKVEQDLGICVPPYFVPGFSLEFHKSIFESNQDINIH